MEEMERATPAAAGHSPRVSDQLDGSIGPEFTVRHAPAQAGDPVTVIIGGAAVAKGRPTSIAFTPAHVRAYERHARLAAQLAMGLPYISEARGRSKAATKLLRDWNAADHDSRVAFARAAGAERVFGTSHRPAKTCPCCGQPALPETLPLPPVKRRILEAVRRHPGIRQAAASPTSSELAIAHCAVPARPSPWRPGSTPRSHNSRTGDF
jgi:hypothetical protein